MCQRSRYILGDEGYYQVSEITAKSLKRVPVGELSQSHLKNMSFVEEMSNRQKKLLRKIHRIYWLTRDLVKRTYFKSVDRTYLTTVGRLNTAVKVRGFEVHLDIIGDESKKAPI